MPKKKIATKVRQKSGGFTSGGFGGGRSSVVVSGVSEGGSGGGADGDFRDCAGGNGTETRRS
ncbi:hypothetical protein A2U01_0076561, partial [Trifolium medium]|nr:hypothetical protein [Trifolium medium]